MRTFKENVNVQTLKQFFILKDSISLEVFKTDFKNENLCQMYSQLILIITQYIENEII